MGEVQVVSDRFFVGEGDGGGESKGRSGEHAHVHAVRTHVCVQRVC